MMFFIIRSLLKPWRHGHHINLPQSRCIFHGSATIKCVRDRGLDHAVEKEKSLVPILNLKNLIKSEPSKSLPLSIIAQNKVYLGIPIRPIDFIRKYPSVFQEYLPGGIGILPHIKLTPEILTLDVEEQLIYQSQNHKQEVADRLLKLLMIARINKIPLQIIDRLKWDLGLPHDYTQSIVPDFPDYFQGTICGNEPSLELVCWSNELAVSVMEKKAMGGEKGYEKGIPISFPLQYSRGFEMDKKFKKWVDEWQKLPYISPYENALHLQPKSDESDKWAVAVLHEFLNLLVPKKTQTDNILYLGEYLGVRSRFKRALLQHPGIFYISSKIGTHTVVLREAYKRDLLLGKPNSLMGLRSKYIHIMNMVKEEKKSKSVHAVGARNQKATYDSKEGEGEEMEDNGSGEEDGKLFDLSDSESECVSEDDYDHEEEENKIPINRGRTTPKMKFERKSPLRILQNMPAKRGRRRLSEADYDNGDDDGNENVIIRGRTIRKENFGEKIPRGIMQNSSARRNPRNLSNDGYDGREEVKNEIAISRERTTGNGIMQGSSGRRTPRNLRKDGYDGREEVKNEIAISRGRTTRNTRFDGKIHLGNELRLDRRRGIKEKSPHRFGRRTEMQSGQNARGRSLERSKSSKSRERQI